MDLNPFELKAWRLALGLTQPQAASALGVQPLAYRLWEWGKRQPENVRMLQLACAMLASLHRDRQRDIHQDSPSWLDISGR